MRAGDRRRAPVDDDGHCDRVDEGAARAVAVEDVHVPASQHDLQVRVRAAGEEGSQRSVAAHWPALKIKEGFLGDWSPLLDSLLQHQPQMQRRRAMGLPHNVQRFKQEAVGIHYDNDV